MKKTSAYLVGALIGLVIIGGIFAIPRWLEEDLGRHKILIEVVWSSVGLFVFPAYHMWRQRGRNSAVFWASLCLFVLLHVLAVSFYSIYIHPILGWQWMILLVVESFAVVSFIDWSIQRFHRPLISNGERD
jgi:hypothetical protein